MARSDGPATHQPDATDNAVSYRQQYRRCGKPNCSRCAPGQPGHGPYWYATWWEGGRTRSRYIGKERPPGAAVVPGPVVESGLRVQTLGGFKVWRGDEPLVWTSKRAAALFKCLLSAPGHRLAREQVMELLWPEADPSLAAVNLRTTAHLLRRTLDAPGADSHLQTEGEMLILAPGRASSSQHQWLDSAAFEQLATDALRGRDPQACRVALALYTGPYLPDDPYEPWSEATRERVQRLRVDVLLHLAQRTAVEGELASAEEALRQVLAEDPAHEDAAAALMSLLAASGRGSEALRAYQALAAALEEELDVAPGADVEALRASIIAQRTRLTAHSPVPATTADKTNLPAQVTSFVGRAWELTEVGHLLDRSRLVTLTGPGGCGKTRLALEVGARLVDRYADGVWLVDLSGLADGALVPAVVAGAAGVEEQRGVSLVEGICEAWHSSRLALVLDNCEHLVAACAELVSALLARCPEVRVLATSREALGCSGEVTHRVPSLAAPDPLRPGPIEALERYEAVALFTDRARARRSNFSLRETNARGVAEICARLDGLPLAIELAAARLSALTVDEVARRLDDRFRLLAGGPRTALPRQQTLRATMDWSHSLLTPAEQALLGRLAVFAGGWSIEAAEAVCAGLGLPAAEVLDRVEGLVQKSLVILDADEGAARYRMLETIRQYAREKLAEAGEELQTVRLHAAYFADFSEEAGRQLLGSEPAAWIRRLNADLDNLRLALQWAQASGEAQLGLRIAAPVWRYWAMSGQSSEGRNWLRLFLGLQGADGASAQVRATALNAVASLAFSQGDFATAEDFFARSLALRREIGDMTGVAESLNGLGVTTVELGDYRRAESCLVESITIWEELGDDLGRLTPMANLGNLAKYRGDYRVALDLYEQHLVARRRAGHTQHVLNALDNLAQTWCSLGQYERARAYGQELLELGRESGIVSGSLAGLADLGVCALEQGHLDEAETWFTEALELSRSIGDATVEQTTRINLADLALERGNRERAAALAEQVLAASLEMGHQRLRAYALSTLSEVSRVGGDHERAAALLEECLALRRETTAMGTIDALEARARLDISRGQYEAAARLHGAAAALRAALGTPVVPLRRGAHACELATLEQALGGALMRSLWKEGEAVAFSYVPMLAEQPA